MKHLILLAGLLFITGLAGPLEPAFSDDAPFIPHRYEVMIQPLTRADKIELASMDALDGVWGSRGRAYLTMDQIGQMRRRGLDVTIVPQPLDLDPGLRAGYHTFAELTSELQAIEAAHPDLCELYNIGNSTQGR
ncbi:MAG: hypothetical protein KJ645_13715, partial [Planctomycetes bacterium]|nr:hypothetical protein [Planctomycetota bacterium]